MDLRTRKLMTMSKIIHLRDDIDRRHVSRKDGRGGFTRIKGGVDSTLQAPGEYTKRVNKRLASTCYVDILIVNMAYWLMWWTVTL